MSVDNFFSCRTVRLCEVVEGMKLGCIVCIVRPAVVVHRIIVSSDTISSYCILLYFVVVLLYFIA